MNSWQRMRLGAAVLLAIIVLATLAFMVIGGRDFIDSLYMVMITVGTVGYTEQSQLSNSEKILIILLIILGVTVIAYLFAGFVQMLTAGELQRVLGQMRMTRDIEKLNEHVIICGIGRTGLLLAEELCRQDCPFVIVENDPAKKDEYQKLNCLVVEGDATQEDVLIKAGIDRAKTLVSALPHDTDNVFIALTARNLNRSLQIISRAEQASTYKKLLQAGANRVVMPTTIGAQRMAAMITRPSTVEFLELVADRSVLDVELDEFVIPSTSPLVGKTLAESSPRREYGLLLVAVKRRVGALIFNPDHDYIFQAEDVAIVMGRTEDISRFRDDHQGLVTYLNPRSSDH
jgi:voltage-gated potassium channel